MRQYNSKAIACCCYQYSGRITTKKLQTRKTNPLVPVSFIRRVLRAEKSQPTDRPRPAPPTAASKCSSNTLVVGQCLYSQASESKPSTGSKTHLKSHKKSTRLLTAKSSIRQLPLSRTNVPAPTKTQKYKKHINGVLPHEHASRQDHH